MRGRPGPPHTLANERTRTLAWPQGMSQISDAAGGVFSTAAGREAPLPLPRGRHALHRDVVVLSQRTRLLDGMVRAVAEHGYPAATITGALRHARVSPATFYEH